MFVCALIWVVINTTAGCNKSPSTPLIDAEAEHMNDEQDDEPTDSQKDDEEDETVEDIALDSEDFDLMCDSYVVPERVQRMPDFIIIGAKKGGTRALIEFLKLHPLVKAAGPEIHYFDTNYDKGLEWYIRQLPSVTPDQMVVEKTPGYFHTPKAPKRIRNLDPNAKLLLILRDPVKRLISDYNQFRNKNLNAGSTYPDIEDLVFTAEGQINLRYPPLQRSIYHVHMKRWLMQFPSEQIHVVNGDAFIKEPWKELNQIETFLDLPPSIKETNFFFNGTKGFYCGKDYRTSGVWSCVKEKCLSKAKGRPKPPLKPGTADKLTEFFKPHNAAFYELMNNATTFEWPTS
jgi:[heparan sulfate]-glucosamine 3-sulfotransferase 1